MATQQEVAKHLDIAERTVRRHLRAGHLPPSRGPGGYDLDACRAAYIRHLRALAADQVAEDPEGLDPVQERARRDAATADKIEHQLAVMKREHVHVHHLELILDRLGTAAAKAFDAIADRLHAKYPDLRPQHIAGLRAEVREATDYVAGLKIEPDQRTA